jgi:uncharacterized protein (DUF2225 family)
LKVLDKSFATVTDRSGHFAFAELMPEVYEVWTCPALVDR